MPDIQWFPGHMARTERELRESVKIADLVIEVIDARIPRSSVNPDFNNIFAEKRRMIVLNKADLADPARTERWGRQFTDAGSGGAYGGATAANSRGGDGIPKIRALLRSLGREKTSKLADRGVRQRPMRAIVAGIPNSGKSSLINVLAKKATAKTGDRPGVTKQRQWIKIDDGIELLDTPGVLWPKFENAEVALHLAFTGAIRDEIIDMTDVAEKLLSELMVNYTTFVEQRYGKMNRVDFSNDDGAFSYLESVGKRRGFLLRGGAIDLERAAAVVLDEFRAAKIGRITLEDP